MTNVFTRKYHRPRTTTRVDFRDFKGVRSRPELRVLSPTRRGNPHPVGLNHQNIPSTSSYLIWNPDLDRKSQRYPSMVHHIGLVNFSCKHQEKYDYVKKPGILPNIRFTENTIKRESYVDPSRFPELAPHYSATRVSHRPDTKPVRGIVPNLVVAEYVPIQY
ncbi:uncharacterized protein LOC128223203 [Mya arenaria]|uniref:uncharacterized protein LOC128223203 n=1 Tax=Mya arenaria TaxID=6604 RepID=UPI0022E0FD28|nr:uncharacterized protein LOC128223203 [Mya arenaria]